MTFILPKRTRVLWQLRTAVAFIFAGIIFFTTIPLNIWVLLLVMFLSVVAMLLVFVYLPLYTKNYKISADNGCLYINKGVFIKSLIVLPCARLVIVKSLVTPVMSLLKLQVVLLKVTKGWIIIPELDCNVTEQLLCTIRGENT